MLLKRIFLFAFFFLFLMPSVAFSDTQTFNVEFFHPATGRNSYLMLHDADTLHKYQFNFGLISSFAYRPLERTNGDKIMDNLASVDLLAAFGILEQLQVGVDIPLIFYNSLRDPRVNPAPANLTTYYFNLGDVRLDLKARVFETVTRKFALAVVPFVTLPSGNSSHYVGDSGLSGGGSAVIDGNLYNRLKLTLNVGAIAGKKVKLQNIEYQYRLILGGGAYLNVVRDVDVFFEGNATSAFNALFSERAVNPGEILVGAKYELKKTGVSIYGAGGTCFVCGTGGAKVRGILGAKYRYNKEEYQKMDEQIVTLRQEKREKIALSVFELQELQLSCPADPADFSVEANDPSCPKYYELKELADLVLRCPNNAEEFNPNYHDLRCPKVFNLAEGYSPSDVQSIYEMSAAEMKIFCPNDPTDFNPSVHDVGCPKYYDIKELASLSSDCPASADQYKEGIDNPECPKFYTLRDTYSQDELEGVLKSMQPKPTASVPVATAASVVGGEIQTFKPVYFGSGSVVLGPEAKKTIGQVIDFINKTSWVKGVRVAGYADSIGSSAINELLSKKRSEMVIKYMKIHGLRPDVELTPVAYGANRPVIEERGAVSRPFNRRVKFIVMSYK